MKSTCDFEMDTSLVNENHKEVLNTFLQNRGDYSYAEWDLEAASTTKMECTLENSSIVYFVGYLAKRSIDNFQCENCKKILVDTNIIHNNSNEILLKHKTFEQIDYLSYNKACKWMKAEENTTNYSNYNKKLSKLRIFEHS
ncbi:hypothetical protein QTP88_001237 [Uroleucon formosanum]